MKSGKFWLAAVFLVIFAAAAMAKENSALPQVPKAAIVLATFGTTHPAALRGILNVQRRVQQAFPGLPVRLAFTSNQVRKVWRQRQGDQAWRQANPQVPPEVLGVQTPLATVANLQDEGFQHIVVQSLHIFAGEEYQDLQSLLDSLRLIKTVKAKWAPFTHLALGRPALGRPGEDHPYGQDIVRAAAALKSDVELAQAQGAALVYLGHGNPTYSTGVYAELAQEMRRAYPTAQIFIGVVEGFPSFTQVRAELKAAGVGKALLKPLMLVAGEHAQNDMCGAADSWKATLEVQGLEVRCLQSGLGEMDPFADIFVEHLRDAMQEK